MPDGDPLASSDAGAAASAAVPTAEPLFPGRYPPDDSSSFSLSVTMSGVMAPPLLRLPPFPTMGVVGDADGGKEGRFLSTAEQSRVSDTGGTVTVIRSNPARTRCGGMARVSSNGFLLAVMTLLDWMEPIPPLTPFPLPLPELPMLLRLRC